MKKMALHIKLKVNMKNSMYKPHKLCYNIPLNGEINYVEK